MGVLLVSIFGVSALFFVVIYSIYTETETYKYRCEKSKLNKTELEFLNLVTKLYTEKEITGEEGDLYIGGFNCSDISEKTYNVFSGEIYRGLARMINDKTDEYLLRKNLSDFLKVTPSEVSKDIDKINNNVKEINEIKNKWLEKKMSAEKEYISNRI